MPTYDYRPSAGSYRGASLRDLASGDDNVVSMILNRGQIESERALRSGDTWANAGASVGQILGQGIMQRAEKKEQTKRSAAVDALFAGSEPPSPQSIIKVFGPKDGLDVIKGLHAINPQTPADQYKDRMERARDAARGVLALPEDKRPGGYKLARNGLVQGGIFKPEEAPEEYNPDNVSQWANYGQEPAKAVKPGLHVVDGALVDDFGDVKYKGDPKPVDLQEVDLEVGGKSVKGTFDKRTGKYFYQGQEIGNPQKALPPPRARGEITPTAEATLIGKLATEWTTASKPIAELDRSTKLMEAGMEAARAGNLAQGSQAVLVTFQKILDPTSVVRESEFDRSAAGQALLTRAKGALERLTKGGSGVPLDELEKFAALARSMAKAQASGRIPAIKERIGKTADRYNIPRELVFENFDSAAGGGAAPAGTAPPGGGQPGAEVTATGPNGQKLVLRNGQWVAAQ